MRVAFPVPSSPIMTIVFVCWCGGIDMVDLAYSAVLSRESQQCKCSGWEVSIGRRLYRA